MSPGVGQIIRHGAVTVIQPDGPLCGEAVEEIASSFRSACCSGQPAVLLDLSLVTLIDSVGLELIYEGQDCCLSRGGVLRLSSANALCAEILRVTELDRHVEVLGDQVTALGSFNL